MFQVNVLWVDSESEVTHHLLVHVLQLMILLDVLIERALEDGMLEKIIPWNSIFLEGLEGSLKEIYGCWA